MRVHLLSRVCRVFLVFCAICLWLPYFAKGMDMAFAVRLQNEPNATVRELVSSENIESLRALLGEYKNLSHEVRVALFEHFFWKPQSIGPLRDLQIEATKTLIETTSSGGLGMDMILSIRPPRNAKEDELSDHIKHVEDMDYLIRAALKTIGTSSRGHSYQTTHAHNLSQVFHDSPEIAKSALFYFGRVTNRPEVLEFVIDVLLRTNVSNPSEAIAEIVVLVRRHSIISQETEDYEFDSELWTEQAARSVFSDRSEIKTLVEGYQIKDAKRRAEYLDSNLPEIVGPRACGDILGETED